MGCDRLRSDPRFGGPAARIAASCLDSDYNFSEIFCIKPHKLE